MCQNPHVNGFKGKTTMAIDLIRLGMLKIHGRKYVVENLHRHIQLITSHMDLYSGQEFCK